MLGSNPGWPCAGTLALLLFGTRSHHTPSVNVSRVSEDSLWSWGPCVWCVPPPSSASGPPSRPLAQEVFAKQPNLSQDIYRHMGLPSSQVPEGKCCFSSLIFGGAVSSMLRALQTEPGLDPWTLPGPPNTTL